MDVCLRVLKESNKSRFDSYSVRNSVLINPILPFGIVACTSFSDNLSRILGDPGAVSRVGRKGETKVWKYGQKSPWAPTLTELFPKIQADAGSWSGTKNSLYYCAQSANSFSRLLFVSSYTTAIVSPHLPGSFIKLVHARKTFIFYFPNQKRRNVWDAISRSNSICSENILFVTHHNVS